MNRVEKLKTLQAVLQGKSETLHELHREKRKKAMPLQMVCAWTNIRQSSPLLLDLSVIPTESLLNGILTDIIPLRECLQRFDRANPKEYYYGLSASGSIDPDDNQFDTVPLDCIQINYPNYSRCYLKDKTIADLRYFFSKSAAYCNERPSICLFFETDLSRFEWYFRNSKSA